MQSMINSNLIDQMDASQSYPGPFEEPAQDFSELPLVVGDENLDECLRSERWKQRKAALSYLKDRFASGAFSQGHVELLVSRLPEFLNDKNVTVLDEGLSALTVFLRSTSTSKSIFQFLVTFFLSNPLNKRLEKKVVELLAICGQASPEQTFSAFAKRLDPDTSLAILTNVLYFLQLVLANSEFQGSALAKTLAAKLKGLLGHGNQKIRRLVIDNIKELARYVLDDFSMFQKFFLEGLKDIHLKELQAAFEEPKHANASFLVQDLPHHSGGGSYLPHSGVLSNIDVSTYGSNSLTKGKAEDLQQSTRAEKSVAKVTAESHRGTSKANLPVISELPGAQEQHQSYEPGGLPRIAKDRTASSNTRVFQWPQHPAYSQELQLPEKFFEIPNLRTAEEKGDILGLLSAQLQNLGTFANILPDQVFTILVQELEESNFLLYSRVLEILSGLLKKSTAKQSIAVGQVKILLSLCASKFNIKASLNELVLSIFSSVLSRKYLLPDVFLKFAVDEATGGRTRNGKAACCEWLATQLVPFVARGTFNDFAKALKAKGEYKKYINKYTEEVGKPADNLPEETLIFLYGRLAQAQEREKQPKNQKGIKDALKALKEQIALYRSNPARFGAAKEENEAELRARKKLDALISQMRGSSDKELLVSGELFVKGLAEGIEQIISLGCTVDSKARKDILLSVARASDLQKSPNSKILETEMRIVLLLGQSASFTKEDARLVEQLISKHGLCQMLIAVSRLLPRHRSSGEDLYRLVTSTFRATASSNQAIGKDDLEDALRHIHSLNPQPSTALKALGSLIVEVLSDSESRLERQDSKHNEFFSNYQSKLEEEREKLQRNLQNLPKIGVPPRIASSQSVGKHASGFQGRIHESESRVESLSHLPPLNQKPVRDPLAARDPQLTAHQSLPSQELEPKDEYGSLENCKTRFLILLENVKRYDQLGGFVSRLSNSFKLLNKIMGKVAFREVSSHLETILSLVASCGEDYTQTFTEFAILVLSILQEPEREKVFVLAMTYLGKARIFSAPALAVFFDYTKNPFRCFKFAFGIIAKNFNEAAKQAFLANLLPVFVERLPASEWSLSSASLTALLPAFFYIVGVVEEAKKSKAANQVPSSALSLLDVKRKVDRVLEKCAQACSAEEIEEAMRRDFGPQSIASQYLQSLAREARVQPHHGNKPDSGRSRLDRPSTSQYGKAEAHEHFGTNEQHEAKEPKEMLAKPPTAVTFALPGDDYTADEYHKTSDVNQEGLMAPEGFLFADQERLERHRDTASPPENLQSQTQSGHLNDLAFRKGVYEGRQSHEYYSHGFQETFGNFKDPASTGPEMRLPNIKTNVSELSREENVIVRKLKSKGKKSLEASPSPSNDRARSYKHMRDYHKRRLLSLDNKTADGQQLPLDSQAGIKYPARTAPPVDTQPNGDTRQKPDSCQIRASLGLSKPNEANNGPERSHSGLKPASGKKTPEVQDDFSNVGPWARVRNSYSDPSEENFSSKNRPSKEPKKALQSPSGGDSRASSRKGKPAEPLELLPDKNRQDSFSSDFEAYPGVHLKPDENHSSFMHQKRTDNQPGTQGNQFPSRRLNTMLVSANSYFPAQVEQDALFETQRSNRYPPAAKQKTISTQTELPGSYSELEIGRLEERVSFLASRNEQITDQLYQLNARNDELRAENERLAASLKANSGLIPARNEATSLDYESLKVGDELCEALLLGQRIPSERYTNQLALYEDMRVEEREKFVFDLKFYVLDKDCLQYIEEEPYAGFLSFVTKLSVFQSMRNSPGGENTLRMLHKILDQLLKAKSPFLILKVLLAIFQEEMPEDSDEELSEFQALHLKLLSKCLKKILDLVKAQGSQEVSAFEVLRRLVKIFASHPPEQLKPDAPSFAAIEELYRLLKETSDEVVALDHTGAQLFVRTFRSSKANAVFLHYLKGLVSTRGESPF